MKPTHCLHCGKQLPPRQRKYCTESCARKAEYQRTKEQIKANTRAYAKRHPDRIKAHNKSRAGNPKHIQKMREYKIKHAESLRAWSALYREKNRELLRQKFNEWKARHLSLIMSLELSFLLDKLKPEENHVKE